MRLPFIPIAALVLWCSPATAATGGPDGWGYSWADSYETGVSYLYEWAPTEYTFGDDDSQSFALGFDFRFYGVSYSTISVNANGLIHFNGTAPPSTNWPLPYEDYALIAPLWDNLDPPMGGQLWIGAIGTAPDRVFIIEWYEIPHYSDVGAVSFEVKLFEADDCIEFHYADMLFDHTQYDWGASATVGIQDGGLGYGLQVSYNQAAVANEYALRFEPCEDVDGDGYNSSECGGTDCNDANVNMNPGATEACFDGFDNDCDGLTDDEDDDCAGDDDDDDTAGDDDDATDDDDTPPPDDDDQADDDDGSRDGHYGIRCTMVRPLEAGAPMATLLALLTAGFARRRIARRR